MIGQNQQVLANVQEPTLSRIVPFDALLIAGTSTGTADTFATVAEKKAMLVKRLVACNVTAMPVTLSFHAVPSGGAIGNSNAQLFGYAIGANAAVDLTDLIGGYYAAGTTLEVYASLTNDIVLSGYYEDVF